MGSTPDSAVDAVVLLVTRRHHLDVDKFPMFSGGRTWQGFCRDLDPSWFEQRAVTKMLLLI